MRALNALGQLLVTLSLGTASLFPQDMFPVRRLTSDSARDGFPSWSPDGKTIIYSFYNRIEGKELHGSRKIPSDGGTPSDFTDFPTEHPQWSPDGRFIVFDADTGSNIKMMRTEGGIPIAFLPDSTGIHNGGLPCWSPSGLHIAFKEGKTSTLCVYDVRTRSVTKILHEEGMLPLPGCWSRDGEGILFALMNRQSRISTMWKISLRGNERQQITGHHEGFYRYLALSPDGTLLVYAAMEGKRLGLWVMPSEGGRSLPLVVTPQDHNECPAWSPDGKRIAFASGRTGRGDIYIMDVDTGQLKRQLKLLDQ